MEDGLYKMLHDEKPRFFSPKYLKRPLYSSCKLSKLEVDLMLLELKCIHIVCLIKALEIYYVC
jgi:hypothetical protein